MDAVVVALYVVGALVGAFSLLYFFKGLAADLLLLGADAVIAVAWLVSGIIFLVFSANSGGPTDAITFWGYILTGVLMPVAGIYLALIERTHWGSLAIGAIAITSIVLAYRLPQIWPGAFA